LERGLRRLRAMDEPTPAAVYRPLPDSSYQTAGKVRKLSWWSAAAAAVLILGGAGVLLYKTTRHTIAPTASSVQNKEIATRWGTRSFQELPDGSKLWLNAGSKVKYADGLVNGRRELTLEGEAFFDVKHDPDHPFVIHTGKLDIKVLGTTFNIKAYPNDSTIETTLIKGRVEIDFKNNTQANILLQPNEKVIVPIKAAPATVNRGDGAAGPELTIYRRMVRPDSAFRTIIETSWVEDKLAFRNEPFSDVSKKLERWYNIHFRFENNNYLQYRLTGYFKEQPIRNVMDALQISLGFHYRIDGDTIHIR
jgi:transmembrane sensor